MKVIPLAGCVALAAMLGSCGGDVANPPAGYADSNLAPHAVSNPASTAASPFPQLAHIIHAGQSLAEGYEAAPDVTGSGSAYGDLQFARGVHTWNLQEPAACANPALRPDGDFALVQLNPSTDRQYTGETIANGLTDHLKASLPRADTRFLFSYAGTGARRLRELDKRHDDDTNPQSPHPTPGGYYKTSIDDVRRAKTQADRLGWSYGVAAITWMQGEAETDYRVNAWSDPLPRPQLLATYMADLITLKNDWNDDIQAITGQKNRIPMFTYQTFGAIAGQAQLMASDADPEVVMVAPTYYMDSSYNNGVDGQWGHWIHLTADSERWLGEQFAKVMRRVLLNNEQWQPLRPLRAWASPNQRTVYVQYHVPRKPLVIDQSFQPPFPNYGFTIPGGPNVVAATVTAEDTLALTLDAPLPAGATLQYAADTPSSVLFQMPTPILAVRDGAAWPNGQASIEIVFAGDQRARFAPLQNSGVFYLRSDDDIAVVRAVVLDTDGNTVLRGEKRELWTGASFKPGQQGTITTVFFGGNVRDSDSEPSLYAFAAGPRKGQSYPLWNWSVAFADLPIGSQAP